MPVLPIVNNSRRMSEFDPYHRWLGISPKHQPPNHYRLLGIEEFEDDEDVIANAADQRMVHVKSFQSGENAEVSQRILNEIATAQRCLLYAEVKATYDKVAPASRANATSGPPPITVAPPIHTPTSDKRFGASDRRPESRTIALIVATVVGVTVVAVAAWALWPADGASGEKSKTAKRTDDSPDEKADDKKRTAKPRSDDKNDEPRPLPPLKEEPDDPPVAPPGPEPPPEDKEPGEGHGKPPTEVEPPEKKEPTLEDRKKARIIVLELARKDAIASGNVDAAVAASDELAGLNESDQLEARLQVLLALSDRVTTKEAISQLSTIAIAIAGRALDRGDKALAKQAAEYALEAARRADDSELKRKAHSVLFDL